MTCCDHIEPCHSGECDGMNEVRRVIPEGRIWNPDRSGTYGRIMHAVGHIKTELNKLICQEWVELNPCTSVRLFEYWADVYKLPKCVDQDQETLCRWIELIYDQSCPIGSQGFLRRAIEFVAPTLNFTLTFNLPDNCERAHCWVGDNICADNNPIVITVDADDLYFEWVSRDYPRDAQDGVEPCKTYFIPEIDCIRDTVFPFGLGLGYKTTIPGPNGEPIFGVPDTNQTVQMREYRLCDDLEC